MGFQYKCMKLNNKLTEASKNLDNLQCHARAVKYSRLTHRCINKVMVSRVCLFYI